MAHASVDPYEDLLDLLGNSGRPDLAKSLRDVLVVAQGRWETDDAMRSYTDHSPRRHGKDVARRALRFIPKELWPDSDRAGQFNIGELYLLTAAALLHDVGMAPPGYRGADIPEEIKTKIRIEHPSQSHDLILKSGSYQFPMGQKVIALLAKSHGTNYFDDAVAELALVEDVEEFPVKLPQLARILLLADEMDLNQSRAKVEVIDRAIDTTPGALARPQLDPVTVAHHFKHYYVKAAQWTSNDEGLRGMDVRFRFPPSLPRVASESVKSWVTRKLRRQVSLTEEVRRGYLHDQLGLNALRVSLRIPQATDESTALHMIPSRALAYIRSESIDSLMPDVRGARKAFRDVLDKAMGLSVVCLHVKSTTGIGSGDQDAIGHDLAEYVAMKLYAGGYVVLRSDAPSPRGDIADVLATLEVVEPDAAGRGLSVSTGAEVAAAVAPDRWRAVVLRGLELLPTDQIVSLIDDLATALPADGVRAALVVVWTGDDPLPVGTTIAIDDLNFEEILETLHDLTPDWTMAGTLASLHQHLRSPYAYFRTMIALQEQQLA